MRHLDSLRANVLPFSGSVFDSDTAKIKHQDGICIWMTGLSGSGKSTIANELARKLQSLGLCAVILDGDEIRKGLCRDLGFSKEDREENIRRVAEVARLMQQAGLIVISALISPFRSDRSFAQSLFSANEFFEIYLDTPIDICETRDPKGLYRKARLGNIRQFTGIDSPYEAPLSPDLKLDTSKIEIDECVSMIIDLCALKTIA